MMRFTVLALTIFLSANTQAAENYTHAYDTNFDMILKTDSIFKPYLDCLLDQGPCSPDAKEFKTMLPEVLSTNCAKCSPNQKVVARVIGRYLQNHKPGEWSLIAKKYDPLDQYSKSFKQFLT